jgi:cobalt/nickel transport system permease protein
MTRQMEQRAVSFFVLVAILGLAGVPVYAMHIAEGFLPPVWAAAWWLVSLPFLAAGVFSLRRKVAADSRNLVLLALSGSFMFVLSALKLPSVTGSCSHPTGAGLGAILFGPLAMTVVSLIVLAFQALLLAHGGVTTLGANLFSMGILGPALAYLTFKISRKMRLPYGPAVFLAAFMANLATYLMTAVQLGLAHPGQEGVVQSVAKFLGLFALTQIPLAIVEGLVSAVIFNVIAQYDETRLRQLRVLN